MAGSLPQLRGFRSPRTRWYDRTALAAALCCAAGLTFAQGTPAPETSATPPEVKRDAPAAEGALDPTSSATPKSAPAPDTTSDKADAPLDAGTTVPASDAAPSPGASEFPVGEDVAAEPAEAGEGDPAGEAANQPDAAEKAPPAEPLFEETAAELAACKAQLRAAGAVFEEAPTRRDADDPDCGIVNPILLSRITSEVEIAPPAELRCATALAMSQWVAEVVTPAAAKLPERGALQAIEQGSAYICRPRNNVSGAKLSEHALGTAIDVMQFRFADAAPIAVEPREREGTMAEAFQRAVRAGSCLYFTTVLGPGTDATHDNHLHLDIKARNGGFRLCQ